MPRSRRRYEGTPSTPNEDKGWYLGIDACVCVLFRIGKKGWVLANKSGGMTPSVGELAGPPETRDPHFPHQRARPGLIF